MNEKGGMNEEHFSKCLVTNAVWPFPNVQDYPGRQVLIKVDCGPGRLNTDVLACMRARGFHLYPGVPNATAVSQEADQSFWTLQIKVLIQLGEAHR